MEELSGEGVPQPPARRPGGARRRLRAVAVVLLGLAALGEAGTGAVAAVRLHDAQVRAARAAAEKRAEARYLVAVRPLVLRVFDAVQPVQDAADAFATLRPGLGMARDDVIVHGGAVSELHAVAGQLVALVVPAPLRPKAAVLVGRLDALTSSMALLVTATSSRGDKEGYVAAFDSGFDRLDEAEMGWQSAVDDLDPSQQLPVPAQDRLYVRGRTAPTLGGFIAASDLACAKAVDGVVALPLLGPLQDVRTNFPKIAALTRLTLATLAATPLPAGQAAFRHRLQVQLEAARQIATSMDALARAATRYDVAGYLAAQRSWFATLGTSRELSRAYAAEGVSACALFFDVDGVGRPKTSSRPGLRT